MKRLVVEVKERARFVGFTFVNVLLIVVLSVFSTLMEAFGLSIFLPIFQYIRLDGSVDALVQESSVWEYGLRLFEAIGLEINLAILLSIAFIFFISRQVFVFTRLVYQAAITQKSVQVLRNKLFREYLSADSAYHDRMPVGNMVNSMVVEVQGAVSAVIAPLELFAYLFMLISYLVLLGLVSWEMTMTSIIVLLLAGHIVKVWVRRSGQVGRKLVSANTQMSSFLVDRLRSPRLVRLAGTDEAERIEFQQLTKSQRKHLVHSSILQAKTEVVLDPVVIALSLIYLYFAYTALDMQIEVMGLYLVIALRLMPVVKGIIQQWQSVQRFLGSIEVVEDRFNTMKGAAEIDRGIHQLESVNEGVNFNKVSFSYYADDKLVLEDVSISFPANKVTAIVGPSGGGKSTLIDLIPHLRSPLSGDISIDGRDVCEITLESLRSAVAYAPQSPQIFDGTVRNHIRYGKKNATNEEVLAAAHLAGADDFISSLPDQYSTLLGEDAVKLSGGQRQRLDLARALVSNAPILILDEPTSNLDAESEEAFRQALWRIRKEMKATIIIVSHRLASIADADQIVVLNQGRVEAAGKHAELLHASEWYSQSWKTQSDIKD